MRFTRETIPALVALTLAFAGCSRDENLLGGNTDERVSIRVSSNIDVTAGMKKKTITRATGIRWEANDQIGIFMLNGNDVDEYANVPYVTASTAGNFGPLPAGEVIYLPVDGSGRDFVAYYPHRGDAMDGKYAINLSAQGDQSAIDFMTSEKTDGADSKVQNISKVAPNVKFRFHHRLAKLRLNIQTGSGFNGDQSALKNLIVTLSGQQTAGTYDVLTDNVVAIVPANGTLTLNTAEDGQTAEAIVFPSNNYDNMTFTFEVDGHATPYTWDLDDSYNASNFEEGKAYIYNITINKTGISVTSTIEDWGQGNGGGEPGYAE